MDLSSLLSSGVVSSLVKSTGVEKKNVSSILENALPTLQDALDDKKTVTSLATLVGSNALTNLLSKDDKKKKDSIDGSEILNTILGSKGLSTLSSAIAKKIKAVDKKTIESVLTTAAPLIIEKVKDLFDKDDKKDDLKDAAIDLIGGLLKKKN